MTMNPTIDLVIHRALLSTSLARRAALLHVVELHRPFGMTGCTADFYDLRRQMLRDQLVVVEAEIKALIDFINEAEKYMTVDRWGQTSDLIEEPKS